MLARQKAFLEHKVGRAARKVSAHQNAAPLTVEVFSTRSNAHAFGASRLRFFLLGFLSFGRNAAFVGRTPLLLWRTVGSFLAKVVGRRKVIKAIKARLQAFFEYKVGRAARNEAVPQNRASLTMKADAKRGNPDVLGIP